MTGSMILNLSAALICSLGAGVQFSRQNIPLFILQIGLVVMNCLFFWENYFRER